MSSLEFNKIAGAVLTAGVVAMSAGFIADLLVTPEPLEEAAYQVLLGEGDGEGGKAAEDGSSLEPVTPLLAAADPASGEKLSKACTACHSFEKGGANKVGPNLWNIVGAGHAQVEGFAYSETLVAMAGTAWGYEELNAFLAGPKAYAPGTKMGYAGMKKVEDRAHLIVWMRSLSDAPQPLPSPEEAAAAAAPAESAEAPAAEPAATQEAAAPAGGGAELALIAAADPAAGEKLTRRCSACHSFDQGGANKVGPNLYNVVGAPVGGVEGFSYSEEFVAKNGAGEVWSYTNLWAFIKAPKEWSPGTKMAFRGLGKDEDLAAMIAYLAKQSENPPPLQ